jgi:hypothetical protein
VVLGHFFVHFAQFITSHHVSLFPTDNATDNATDNKSRS